MNLLCNTIFFEIPSIFNLKKCVFQKKPTEYNYPLVTINKYNYALKALPISVAPSKTKIPFT